MVIFRLPSPVKGGNVLVRVQDLNVPVIAGDVICRDDTFTGSFNPNGSGVASSILRRTSLRFKIISDTSSFTPGMTLNSCSTDSNRTDTMAAPYREERIVLLKELPRVIPNPLSSGSHTNLPYASVLVTRICRI
jgi:hypothetical protein